MKIIISAIIALGMSSAPMLAQQRGDQTKNESPRINSDVTFAGMSCAQLGLSDCNADVKVIRVSDDTSNVARPRIKRMPWTIGAFQ